MIPASAEPVLEELVADPERAVESPRSVARSRMGRKRFYRLAADGGPAVFFKIFGAPSGALAWLRSLRSSRARREVERARRLRELGFAAVEPLAFGEERRGALRGRSFLAVLEVPARDLRAVLLDPQTSAARRRELMYAFGRLQRRLHDAGVDQDDTSPNNFLVGPGEDFTLIDFERCEVGKPLGEPRRWKLLAKLQRHRLGVSQTARLHFLRGYLGDAAGRRERRQAVQQVNAELRRVRRHDARRAARAAFKVGRHVVRDGSAWQVRDRESASVIRLVLDRREARRVWVLSHQLERLALPVLRPARLDETGVELALPGPSTDSPSQGQIRRARRQLEQWGRFEGEPEWVAGPDGAILRDPRVFELEI